MNAAIDGGGGLRFDLSGSEPEYCELLTQFVPIHEGNDYQLTADLRSPSVGMGWHITDAKGTTALRNAPLDPSHPISFTTPSGCHVIRLALVYNRVAGTTRLQGSIVVKRVVLKPKRD